MIARASLFDESRAQFFQRQSQARRRRLRPRGVVTRQEAIQSGRTGDPAQSVMYEHIGDLAITR
jgi:hypothetical protein